MCLLQTLILTLYPHPPRLQDDEWQEWVTEELRSMSATVSALSLLLGSRTIFVDRSECSD